MKMANLRNKLKLLFARNKYNRRLSILSTRVYRV